MGAFAIKEYFLVLSFYKSCIILGFSKQHGPCRSCSGGGGRAGSWFPAIPVDIWHGSGRMEEGVTSVFVSAWWVVGGQWFTYHG
jgi:hypothetical protein